jgi:hypothetical protein
MAKPTKREDEPTSGTDPGTQQVVDLLTSILTQARTQIGSTTQIGSSTPKQLEGDAQNAVALFREIGQTLDLLPTTIIWIANPTRLDQAGDVRLTWSSTEAREVSIAAENASGDPLPQFSPGEVPAEDVKGGSVVVRNVSGTTIFTATAKGPCSAAEAEAEVVFGNVVP